jgi:hypothetical protein
MRPSTHLAATLLLTLGLACGGDSTSPTASIAGTWNLSSINGSPLPFTIQQVGTTKLEVVSDVAILTASNSSSGSFTETTTSRLTQNGQVSTQTSANSGTYTLNGTAVVFVSNTAGTSNTGSWSGNTLTLAENGVALVFVRQ